MNMDNENKPPVHIIHHWDTDGIVSAAMIARREGENGGEWSNTSPPIGVFDIDQGMTDQCRGREKTYVLDLNLPDQVEKLPGKVVFIDHHVHRKLKAPNIQQINPLAEGRTAEEYPAASWIVAEYLDRWDHLSVLGALGDRGIKVLDQRNGKKMRTLLSKARLSTDDALKLVAMMDSNYVTMDKKGVEEAVSLVLNKEPKELLNHKPWKNNLDSIETELKRVLDTLEPDNNIARIDFRSGYNIISRIAREATWNMGYGGAVAVNREFHDMGQVYFRIRPENVKKFDIPGIIQTLKNKGVNAGGKPEVVGIICKKESIEMVLDIIFRNIEEK